MLDTATPEPHAPRTDLGDPASLPSVDQIATVLTHEIDRLRSQAHRPGWTPWALVAALGASSWALLGVLEQSAPDTTLVAKWSVMLIAAVDSLLVISGLLAPSTPPLSRNRYLYSRVALGHSRLEILYSIAQCAVLLTALRILQQAFPVWLMRVATLQYGTGVLLASLGLILSFVGLPVSVHSQPSRAVRAFICVAGSVPAATLGLIGWTVAYKGQDASPTILKAAGLVLAIQLSVKFLAATSTEPPLIETLRRIRFRVLLGQTSRAEALRDIEVSTLGLQASDVLQRFIRDLIQAQEDIRAEIMAGVGDVSSFTNLLTKAGAASGEEGLAVERAIRKDCRDRLSRVEALLDQYRSLYDKYKLRASMVGGAGGEALAPIASRLTEGAEEIRREWLDYKESLNRVLPLGPNGKPSESPETAVRPLPVPALPGPARE